MTVDHKLWIGEPGRFREEVDALTSLLSTSVLAKQANLWLAAERREAFDWICASERNAHENAFDGGGWIALQSSGTTGVPKWVRKRFDHILAQKKGRGARDDKWLLCYSPARWAGMSVIVHVLKHSAQLMVPCSLDPPHIVAAMDWTTHVSLTPSMFRKILLHAGDSLASSPIRQITFGGEYASQRTLDDAKAIWPRARVTHVYASTELGDICAVNDGKEGIPHARLRHFQLTGDGELVIEGHATGDLWERRGDRLIFQGRREEIINVGGAKVAPSLVEAACMGLAEISECRAYAVKNALLGEVVGLDYVGTIEPRQLRSLLIRAVPKFALPGRINRVNAIALTAAGKTPRRT